jgi:hypothetical protein
VVSPMLPGVHIVQTLVPAVAAAAYAIARAWTKAAHASAAVPPGLVLGQLGQLAGTPAAVLKGLGG